MEILCFIDNLNSGGAQRQMVNLAVLLKKRGHLIQFVTYHESSFYKELLLKADIEPVVIEGSNKAATFLKVIKHLRSFKGDCVISFLDMPNFLASVASIGKVSWKLIISERSAKYSAFTGLKQRIMKFFSQRADYIVCNSFNAKAIWEKFYPKAKNKLKVIYNPVTIGECCPSTIRTGEKTVRVVIAASYQGIKNPIRVIKAISNLTAEEKEKLRVDWYGRIEVTAGDTKIYDQSQELITQLNLADVIGLHGETKDIYSIMNNADAVALFSVVEGLPNVICEGMTLGKPILMSRVSDYDTLVNGNGFTCDPHDISSITDCFKKLLRLGGDDLSRMGLQSRKIAEQLFSPPIIIEKWEELCEN